MTQTTTDPADIGAIVPDDGELRDGAGNSLCELKLAAIEALVRGKLPHEQMIALLDEVFEAPGWTIHHVTARIESAVRAALQEAGE